MIGLPGIRRHAKLRELLSAYIDGEVSGSESLRVERHLASCEECQAELTTLRSTVGLLRQLPELAVPRSFALREAPQRRRAPTMVWTARLATSAAAVLLVALLLGDVVGLIGQQDAAEEAASIAPAPAAAAPMAAAATAPAVVERAVPEASPEEGVSATAASALEAPAAPPSAAPAPLQAADAASAEASSPVPEAAIAPALESDTAPAPAAAAPAPAAPVQAMAAAVEPTPTAQAMSGFAAPEPSTAEGAIAAPDEAPRVAAAAEPPAETDIVSTQTRQPEPEALVPESIRPVLEADSAVAQPALEDIVQEEEPKAEIVTSPAEALTQETRQDAPEDGGLALPLWQLEVAAGILLATLAAATFWVTRRTRWRG